jgi:hypothetical protein
VERSTAGLDVAALTQEVQILQLVPVEVAGDIDALRPHNDDLKMEFNLVYNDPTTIKHAA